MNHDERFKEVYMHILSQTLESIPYVPKYKYVIDLFNHSRKMAYFNFRQKTIGMNRTLGLNLRKVADKLAHEVVHLIQAERDQETYLRMTTLPNSGLFRLVFHDTLINCLELEARLFEKQRKITLAVSELMLRYRSDLSQSPFEWLILNPVQAMKLYQTHLDWGYLYLEEPGLQEYADKLINQCTTTALVPEANILLELLVESLSILQETAGDNVSSVLFARTSHPFETTEGDYLGP